MREPTPRAIAFEWHAAMLAHLADPENCARPLLHEEDPHCGFYRYRQVPRGEFWPCAIWLNQPVDDAGQLTEPETFVMYPPVLSVNDGWKLRTPETAWTWVAGNAISEDEYNELLNIREGIAA